MNAFSDAVALGQETFLQLAERAGIAAGRYAMTQHWIKNDANRFHVVLRFEGSDQSLILKQVFRPEGPKEFTDILDAHFLAQKALANHPVATVPAVLAEDRMRKAFLMRFQPGETLRDLCAQYEDHHTFLRQAGRWLSAYHRATMQQERIFQPHFMAKHVLRLVDQIEAGKRRIRSRRRFIALAHYVQELVPRYQGRLSIIAAKHGDMNAHNLLIDGPHVAAYDFLPISYVPVGYDIARLLLSYALSSVDLTRIPKEHVLPPDALEAFFEGYDLVGPEDPSVQFLLRIQILTDWNRLADKKGVQTLIAFERLRVIARKAFI